MTVIRFFLVLLTIYFLYRFIFHLIIPVYKASKKIHRQFRNMQQQASDNINTNQHTYNSTSANQADEQIRTPAKDYIEFEEIKE
ncbi:MAG: hypothetical protein WKF97_02685 [Chitinophagaceae bacterium]